MLELSFPVARTGAVELKMGVPHARTTMTLLIAAAPISNLVLVFIYISLFGISFLTPTNGCYSPRSLFVSRRNTFHLDLPYSSSSSETLLGFIRAERQSVKNQLGLP